MNTCKYCDWLEMGICKCPYTRFRGMRMGTAASCFSWVKKRRTAIDD